MSNGEFSLIRLVSKDKGKKIIHKIGGKFFKSLTGSWALGGFNKQLEMRRGLIDLIEMTRHSNISDNFKKDLSLKRNKYQIVLRGNPSDTIEIAIIIAIAKGVITKEEVLKLLSVKPKYGE